MYGYLWCISLTDSICTGAGTNLTKQINRIVSTGWTLKNFLPITKNDSKSRFMTNITQLSNRFMAEKFKSKFYQARTSRDILDGGLEMWIVMYRI
jgi:hypothetical protein